MADTPRRSTTRRATGEAGPLFQGTTGPLLEKPRTIVLSSNFTVGPLLARGALLPDALEGDALLASDTSLRLRWAHGSLADGSVSALVESARNVIPIAIRLRPDHSVRRLAIPGCSDSVEAICVSDVEALAFRTEKERDRFESLEFSNYDLSSTGICLCVDPSLFEEAVSGPTATSGPESPQAQDAPTSPADVDSQPATSANIDDEIRAVRTADCLTGLLAFLLTHSPGRRSWMNGVQYLFTKNARRRAGSWPERLASAALGGPVDASPAEKALLTALVAVLRRYPVEGGWPSEQVLADTVEQAKGCLASQDERASGELDRWAARANDVLASKAEPQSLADDGFVLQRATLLLLLRGDLDGLAGGEVTLNGARRPGALVRGTAGALAAMRTGLRAMPARFKAASDMSAPAHWLQYLGEVFLTLLQTPNPIALVPSHLPSPTVTYRPIRTLQGEWVTSTSSHEIARTSIEVDHGLERLLTMGQHLGFDFQEHGDDGLVASVPAEDGRAHPVYLELIQTGHGNGPMVRFSAPALTLLSVGPKPRLTRDLAFNLLKRNADPGMSCRFAINDRSTEVLVLVDQLLSTLDDAEFVHHIEHVAKVAADFKLAVNVEAISAS